MTTEFRPTSQSSLPETSSSTAAFQPSPLNGLSDQSSLQEGLKYRGVAYGLKGADSVAITHPSKYPWMRWFNNLSVRQKQLLALSTSELISILGLVGVGSILIVVGGRNQLLNQAQAELAVSEVGYNIKINQMEFGFRGQSDNQAIVSVAEAYDQGQAVPQADQEEVKRILQNEIKARKIEYATLVGRDLKIIVNANVDRVGDRFDPDGLVGTVLQNPRQIRATSLVSWTDLQKEAPPLPQGLKAQDALIRYTVTPVKNPKTNAVVGALISGDIVNGKLPIVEGTLSSLHNGYSAVYQRQADGSFRLATALDAGDNPDIAQAETEVALTDPALLEQAVKANGKAVTRRDQVGDRTYTLAAKAISNYNGTPTALLVRGTSETPLNQLIGNSLKLQLVIALLALAINFAISRLLGHSILKPLQELRQTAWRFGMGDRLARAEIYASDEVGQVAQTFNQLADSVTQSEHILQKQSMQDQRDTERAQMLFSLTSRIRQSLDPETILTTSVDGLREVLKVDRVLMYQFNSDLKSGVVTTESVGSGWKPIMGHTIEDPLTPEAIDRFYAGRVTYVEDLATAQLTHCHCELLERMQVKANLIAPILAGQKLVGLICAHQCSTPRKWEASELELMQQVSNQIGYALNQAYLVQQQQQITEKERQLSDIVLRIRQSLEEEQIYRVAVTESRRALHVQRSLVYLFDATWRGTFAAESVELGWPAALTHEIYDPCFAEKYVEPYRQGRIQATPDIYNAGLTDCHLRQLEPYKVKASLVAPIIVNEKLIGLLIAHQCDAPREWTSLEINFFRQVATQLGYAIEQSRLFSQAEALSEERRQAQEALQRQLVDLLSDVEGASRGDLTVRADVTAGEIGTVADFFNSIVESLRQIVIQVKYSAAQVNASLGQNEGAISSLAEAALRQAEETTHILNSVEDMTQSIQQVAERARRAAEVAHSASSTAETSGSAMDLTVHNILNLREIIGETSKKVKRLGESSQQISKAVSLINQIAMQTNLLAINAGIEAARAGEEGQGFAVVAEEVGELAARSADATKEIERIVENIQRETAEVVDAMEQSTSKVVEGTHYVEDAKRNLSQILEVSRQIDDLVQSISEATVSQVETSQSVSRLMQDIAQVSEQTSDSSRQISGALRETVEVARELQASVGTFNTGDVRL